MYKSKLTLKETQLAIKYVKDDFEDRLSQILNLQRVSAPMMVISNEGVNDDLGIKNSALKFHFKSLNKDVEIVQSLAKWKRIALKKYEYQTYEGIYTDMNAIRPKETLDQLHSYYVDQWDWELVISNQDKTVRFLEEIVRKIVKVMKETKEEINKLFPQLKESICEDVYFIDSETLLNTYPNLDTKARERAITKAHKTVFVSQIGHVLSNGKPHDKRAFDYDNWHLNGDILIWSETLNDAVELSSMGIRVDEKALIEQRHKESIESNYHQMILNQLLPQTIGGGIGQSRLCMIFLEKMHIAEVQASIWDDATYQYFEKNKITYL